MSTQRKKIVAAVTAALLHHEHVCAAVVEAEKPTVAETAPPAGFGAVCLPAPSAWAFAGRYDHMAQRVQRQARRAG